MALKRIAVLTSGGDAPGMNAAVRAAARTALFKGIEVFGVYRGYNGLINNDLFPMNLRSVSDIIHRGGTMLFTARCSEFNTEEGIQKAIKVCNDNGINGVVVIGGDGSLRGAQDLSRHGMPCIGIPGTIDNDISCCEYTIGYDTAMNTCMGMVDRLRDTAQSHDRCSVVEVMGRNAGYLALNVGIAVGATSIIVPEVPFDFERDIITRMKMTSQTGKKHFIVVVAEGVGGVMELADEIQKSTGIESRATILGHVQRGGSPSVRDRVLASEMGYHAVELLIEGKSNRVVATQNDSILDYDIEVALRMKKPFDFELYNMAHEISI
ncbi:MAG: 6-phosphofructokinase [Oscillospiraceae bacterium]|nr:6-phosphofructokinase [Oscillospiraceae bacterium]MDD4414166.1 6-phosphofructokinase [Oscillospiraceae bacterium]